MRKGRLVFGALGVAALTACGHVFPAGERLLPQSYGPPFGAALKANIPAHPHNPADDERHAAADEAKNKKYNSHAACTSALLAQLSRHARGPEHLVRISSVETLGHYEHDGAVHEYRCADYVLSYRAWCPSGSGSGEHHKKAPGACKDEGNAH